MSFICRTYHMWIIAVASCILSHTLDWPIVAVTLLLVSLTLACDAADELHRLHLHKMAMQRAVTPVGNMVSLLINGEDRVATVTVPSPHAGDGPDDAICTVRGDLRGVATGVSNALARYVPPMLRKRVVPAVGAPMATIRSAGDEISITRLQQPMRLRTYGDGDAEVRECRYVNHHHRSVASGPSTVDVPVETSVEAPLTLWGKDKALQFAHAQGEVHCSLVHRSAALGAGAMQALVVHEKDTLEPTFMLVSGDACLVLSRVPLVGRVGRMRAVPGGMRLASSRKATPGVAVIDELERHYHVDAADRQLVMATCAIAEVALKDNGTFSVAYNDADGGLSVQTKVERRVLSRDAWIATRVLVTTTACFLCGGIGLTWS